MNWNLHYNYHFPTEVFFGPGIVKTLGSHLKDRDYKRPLLVTDEGLSKLPEQIQQSWFAFDHFYSDEIFGDALPKVFRHQPKTLFDIGGNTGKFAILCAEYNPDVSIKIFDLPGQLSKALGNAKQKGLENRISGQKIDWLSEDPTIPEGADTIWMSQFLDCFSKKEILKILTICKNAMDAETELIIIESKCFYTIYIVISLIFS